MKTFHKPEDNCVEFLDERFYTRDGETFYPSVTTVLDVYPKGFGYMQWLKDMGSNAGEVLARAGEQGTKVHNAIEKYLKGELVGWAPDGKVLYSELEWQMIMRFVEFWNTYKPIIIAGPEKTLISETIKVGGTIDIVCEINGELWLIDYKTSNGIYKTHELQLAAYCTLWNEFNIPERHIKRTGDLWLKSRTRGVDKTGKKMQGKNWSLVEFDRHYEDGFKLYEHVRRIWDEENPNPKPKNLIYPDKIKLENNG